MKGVTMACAALKLLLLLFSAFIFASTPLDPATLSTDAHSLHCDLTITAAEHKGHCSLDGMSVLKFDNINKPIPLDNQGEIEDINELQKCLTSWLKPLAHKLRNKVSNIKEDTHKTSGSTSLQATMAFQQSQQQITDSSFTVDINGKYSLNLDIRTGTWSYNTVPENIVNKWTNDAELKKDLYFFIAECREKLNEFLERRKERPTLPTTAADVDQPPSMACKSNPFLGLIMISLIYFLLHDF